MKEEGRGMKEDGQGDIVFPRYRQELLPNALITQAD